jgi:parallel beta-helix repeat protein
MKKWLAIGIILLFIGTCVIPAIAQNTEKPLPARKGSWLYVGGSGPGNYSAIQSAIDNSSNDDIIFIYKGVYRETLQINKNLAILGEDRQDTIIDAGQSEQYDVLTVNASSISLNNLTIQNSSKYKAGVRIQNLHTQSMIQNCTLLTKEGINVFSSENLTIDNCLFREGRDGIFFINSNNSLISKCDVTMEQFGININTNSFNNSVINCTVNWANNSSYISNGICSYACKYCYDGILIHGNRTIIKDCACEFSKRNGLEIYFGNFNNISHCQFENNGFNTFDPGFGINFYNSSGSSIEDCAVINNSGGGIHFSFVCSGDNIITKSTIAQNGFDNDYGGGIICYSANKIYLNSLIGNKVQAMDCFSNCEWDNGKEGNFWSDYSERDWNRDGIGDKPYLLFNHSQDNFPLLCPYNPDGPSVLLERPAHIRGNFLYVGNLKIKKSTTTILIGNIKLKALAVNYCNPDRITKVAFYVDGVRRDVDLFSPYTWCWRLSSPLHHTHTITVIAYDSSGRVGQDSCIVSKIF